MKTMQELEAELLKAEKEAAINRDKLKTTTRRKVEELKIETRRKLEELKSERLRKAEELESERLRKAKELESEELTKAKELEDEALRKQQALCQKIADRKTFLEQLTAQLSKNLDACDIADLKKTELSEEEQLKTAVDLLKIAIQLKKPDAIVALLRICDALNRGTLPFHTLNSDDTAIPLYPVVYGENSPQPVFSPWELIIASIASGDPKIFQLVYSTLATEKDRPLALAWLLYEGKTHFYTLHDKKWLNVYTAILTTTNPEDQPRIQEAVEKILDEQLSDPNINMMIKFTNCSSLNRKKTEVKKAFKETMAFYKEQIVTWAISQNDITSFISGLKNLNDTELRSYSMNQVALIIKEERTDFLEHLLTHYYKDEQKRSEVICSFNKTREIKHELRGSFSMLAAAAQSQNPKIVSLALKFYPSNAAKLKAMIAKQKAIYSKASYSYYDYQCGVERTKTYHCSVLAIAASQFDVKVLQALVQRV